MTITSDKYGKVREVERVWLSREEAAKYMCASVATIKKLNLLGKLGFSRLDRKVYIHRDDIDKLLMKHKVI